jgi:CheY-like chemotaxis protein
MNAAKHRVLLVEDEVLITMLVEEMLVDLGCEIAACAARLDEALIAARTETFDLALIDLSLGGKLTYPVVEILKARQIPFAFVTGYGSAHLDPLYAGTPVLDKPFHREDLASIIAAVVPSRETD